MRKSADIAYLCIKTDRYDYKKLDKATRNGIIIDGIEYKLVEGVVSSCTRCPLLDWRDRHYTSCKPCELWGSGYHFELGEQERYIDTNKQQENK